jgi:hypothetical protein
LVSDLRSADIAHGDLQHGNVLVLPNGDIRLIDYDGMWVPTLEGEKSNETGHPDFQNPGRTQNDFHCGIDEFSAAVIEIAISALIRDPSLWEKYNNGDNILFRRRDFVNPQRSPLVADLQAMNDRDIRKKLDFVINACTSARRASKHSARPASMKKPVEAPAPTPASWLTDHVEDYGTTPQSPRRSSVVSLPPPRQSSVGMLGKMVGWLLK